MAGVTLGFLKYVLGFDSIQFRKGMSEADRDLVKLQKSFERTGQKLTSIGKTLSLGITAPLAAIGLKSFDTAKDVAEMQSAFDVTFGSMSASVRKWAEETGDAMGRSTQEIQAGALAFQELFGKALDPKKSAEMSKTFAVLSQDLASFKNLSNEVAQQKIFSGLSGEAEPLRAVGVFLSEAKVQAAALELGLTGVNGKLTEEEKILARAAVIQRELAKANGDVIRTSGGTANQIKAMQAAWAELQVVIGTKLLPVLTPLIEKVASAINWFVQLPAPVQNTALAIAAVSAAIGPVLIGFGSLVTVIAHIGPAVTALVGVWTAFKTALIAVRVAALATLPALTPFLVPLAAIAAAVGVAYLAWKNWDRIPGIVQRMVTAVRGAFGTLTGILRSVLSPIAAVQKAFFTLYDKVVGHSYVPDMVDGIRDEMARLDGVMVKPAGKATKLTAEAFDALKSAVSGLLAQLFPDQARENDFLRQVKLLDDAVKAGAVSASLYQAALAKLETQMGMTRDGLTNPALDFGDGPQVDMPELPELPSLEAIPDAAAAANDAMKQVASEGLRSLVDGLTAVVTGTAKLGDVFRSVAQQIIAELIRIQIQKMIMSLADSIFGAGTGTNLFGGFRAAGGPVARGKAYIVGEKGPELFMPNAGGKIVANDQVGGMMGGGGGPVTINVSGPMSRREARETGYQAAGAYQRKLALAGRR